MSFSYDDNPRLFADACVQTDGGSCDASVQTDDPTNAVLDPTNAVCVQTDDPNAAEVETAVATDSQLPTFDAWDGRQFDKLDGLQFENYSLVDAAVSSVWACPDAQQPYTLALQQAMQTCPQASDVWNLQADDTWMHLEASDLEANDLEANDLQSTDKQATDMQATDPQAPDMQATDPQATDLVQSIGMPRVSHKRKPHGAKDQRGLHWREKVEQGVGPKISEWTAVWADTYRPRVAKFVEARGVGYVPPWEVTSSGRKRLYRPTGNMARLMFIELTEMQHNGVIADVVTESGSGLFGIKEFTVVKPREFDGGMFPSCSWAGATHTTNMRWRRNGFEEVKPYSFRYSDQCHEHHRAPTQSERVHKQATKKKESLSCNPNIKFKPTKPPKRL